MYTGDFKQLYHRKFPIIEALIQTLYEIPECAGTGGMIHVIVDENNIKDNDIIEMLDYFSSHEDEYKERIEYELAILICQLLLQLSYPQRCCLFILMEHNLPTDQDSFGYFEYDINKYMNDYCKE